MVTMRDSSVTEIIKCQKLTNIFADLPKGIF